MEKPSTSHWHQCETRRGDPTASLRALGVVSRDLYRFVCSVQRPLYLVVSSLVNVSQANDRERQELDAIQQANAEPGRLEAPIRFVSADALGEWRAREPARKVLHG